jgi:hypothetical protein
MTDEERTTDFTDDTDEEGRKENPADDGAGPRMTDERRTHG